MSHERGQERRWIYVLQLLSVGWIWVFVLGISWWIVHLMRLSRRLHDVPSASVGISIVAIPVFFTVAVVLTYVFVGLQRGRRDADAHAADPHVADPHAADPQAADPHAADAHAFDAREADPQVAETTDSDEESA